MTAAVSRPLALTIGDAAGIGPEIIVQAFLRDPQALRGCVVVGDVAALQRAAEVVARAQPDAPMPLVERIDALSDLTRLPEGVLPVWSVGTPWTAAPGQRSY